MKNTSKRLLSLVLVLAMVVGLFSVSALAAPNYNPGNDTELTNLRVDSQVEPITIDPLATAPVNFSWEMVSNVLGQEQAAYKIVVTDEYGTEVWNSGKVESGNAVDIAYEGDELTPDTKYTWEVTVWDVYGSAYAAESTFETAWLSTDLSAWKGADFIGIKKLILDADRQLSFGINTDFQINKGAASIVFGGNDLRLNNQFNNMWKIDGSKGNYARIELDISGLAEGGKAEFVVKNLNHEALAQLENNLRKNILQLSMTPDLTDESFSGNASGVALQYKLWGIEQVRSGKERSFTEGVFRMLEALSGGLSVLGAHTELEKGKVTFYKNLPQNHSELVESLLALSPILSSRTILEQLPWVPDVEEELRRKKAEA